MDATIGAGLTDAHGRTEEAGRLAGSGSEWRDLRRLREAAVKLSTLLSAPVLAVALVCAPSLVAPTTRAVVTDAGPAVVALRLVEHASVRLPRTGAPQVQRAPAAPRVRTRPLPVLRRAVRPVAAPRQQGTPVQRAQEAFASLHITLPTGWSVQYRAHSGSYQGMCVAETRTVTIWARARDSRQELRITIAHELGHALDFTTITKADQQRYLALRGKASYAGRWYPGYKVSDYASPAGDFAEVYALWAAGPGDFRSQFAPKPTRSELKEIGRLFRELRARQP